MGARQKSWKETLLSHLNFKFAVRPGSISVNTRLSMHSHATLCDTQKLATHASTHHMPPCSPLINHVLSTPYYMTDGHDNCFLHAVRNHLCMGSKTGVHVLSVVQLRGITEPRGSVVTHTNAVRQERGTGTWETVCGVDAACRAFQAPSRSPMYIVFDHSTTI